MMMFSVVVRFVMVTTSRFRSRPPKNRSESSVIMMMMMVLSVMTMSVFMSTVVVGNLLGARVSR
jgi:hypothetical protein